jgi:2-iminobutanoate/2-iminopropanoate deaminase
MSAHNLTPVSTAAAPAPRGAYSQGIVAGGLLFTAGFGPWDAGNAEVVGTTIEEQTGQVLDNIEALLATQGLDLSDVVKATVHLQDLRRDFAGFNRVYQDRLRPPYPVRTTVGSTLPGILVEIDMVAALRTAG